jgi:hypothetical protein
MSYDDDNIFAKILRGEIPCKKVAEDEHTLAFAGHQSASCRSCSCDPERALCRLARLCCHRKR